MKTTSILMIISILLTATSPAAQEPVNQNGSTTGMRLEWTHFIGGRSIDGLGSENAGAVIDRDGVLTFAGCTSSPDFPTTPDAVQKESGGNQDDFVIRFDTRQQKVVYSTYLGGAKDEVAFSQVCVDPTRHNILIASCTGSANFPTTEDALIRQFQGPDFGHADGFLTILGDDGRKLTYSTILGGPKMDLGAWNVFVEPSGDIAYFGHASSFGFLPEALQQEEFRNLEYNAEGWFVQGGNFAMKLDVSGRRILSVRYRGDKTENSQENVHRLETGDYLIAGNTRDPNCPTTAGVFSRTHHGSGTGRPKWGPSGGGDLMLMRLSEDLQTVVFATLLGGSGDECKPLVTTVPGGDIFVFAYTSSKDLPVTPDAIEKTMTIDDAVFLARISGDGRELKYCTYLGGKSGTTGRGKSLVYDGKGRVYATWVTSSPDCPVTPDAAQAKLQGGSDVCLIALNVADNSLAYGSYLGGSKDEGACLAFDGDGALYVVGGTNSDDFPTGSVTTGVTGIRENGDLFITKFLPCP